jgi:hypothetical protein
MAFTARALNFDEVKLGQLHVKHALAMWSFETVETFA